MSGNRSAPRNAVVAREHRRSQVDHELGIDELTTAQRKELLAYIKKNKGGSCQHLMQIHRSVPHPKYGDRVPHFETAEVPDPMKCPCEEAQRFRDSLGV